MDLSAPIATFQTDVVRRRPGATVVTNGYATAGADTSTTIQAVVLDVPGSELVRLPENDRGKAMMRFVSVDDLALRDVLEWGGRDYEIKSVKHRTPQGLYYDAIGVRRGQ